MSREQQIVEAIRQLYAEGSIDITIHQIRETHARHPKNWPALPYRWEPLVGAVLRTLESTGFIRANGAGRYRLMQPIELRFDFVPPESTGVAPNGEPRRPPPGNRPPDVPPEINDGGGGDGGGAGYREVLSHPSLFSSTADDFNRLLARIGGRS